LGHNVTIMPGIKIGDGAIIAANATVTKHVEPYSVVGGNPAALIRKRFSNENIKWLLNTRWWDWDIGKIIRNIHKLTDKNIELLQSTE